MNQYKAHSTTYFVNGEEEVTDQKTLSVRQILVNAGFNADEYTLKSEDPKRDYNDNYDEEVEIHPNQRFDALHKGPTPTS